MDIGFIRPPSVFPDDFGDTSFPANFSGYVNYGDIVIASSDTQSTGGGGGCSIVGVKICISDALAGYGLLIVAGVLWGIRRRGK